MTHSNWCGLVFHIYLAAGFVLAGTNGSWLIMAFCFGFALFVMVIGIVCSLRENKSGE